MLAPPAAANESPVAVPEPRVKGPRVLELFDLKEDRRFCAEDFLRMVGRGGWSTEKWDIAANLYRNIVQLQRLD